MKNFYEKVLEALKSENNSCNCLIMAGEEGNVVCVNYFENPFVHFSNLDWEMYKNAIKIAYVNYDNTYAIVCVS